MAETVRAPTAVGPGRSVNGLDRRLAGVIAGKSRVALGLWDGSVVQPAPGRDTTTAILRIRDRRTLYRLAWRPALAFAEGYCAGAIDCDGDLAVALTVAFAASPSRGRVAAAGPTLRALVDTISPRSRTRARRNAQAHYGLGTDFYRRWLDPRMVYTCAYFPEGQGTLEAAQVAKLDRVARKLGVREGTRVVELGCGWGALAVHLAARYGAYVRAFNVSEEQVAYAREAARHAGMASRVEFIADDYRAARGRYDAVASIGMLEHVGKRGYRELGSLVAKLLGGEGRALIHSIARHRPMPTHPWIQRHIFPGGYAPSLGEMRAIFEPSDLVILDVENLRPHYALTLDHWRRRFAAARPAIASGYGEALTRRWELYLAASAASFATGWSQLYQVLCAPRASATSIWSRPENAAPDDLR